MIHYPRKLAMVLMTLSLISCGEAQYSQQTGIRQSYAQALPPHANEISAPPHFKKIMIVIFENTDYDKTMSQDFFEEFAFGGTLFSNYFGLTHPSQPNYLAMVGGTTFKLKTDKNVNLNAEHLGDLIEAQGRTWRVYAEDYPGNCFLGTKKYNYVRKHVPFLSFINIQHDPLRCANIVNASQLERDIQGSALPDFSFYIPDQKNNGHDTGVAYANTWFAKTFKPLLAQRKFMQDLLLVSTFDEGSSKGDNQIYTAFFGDMIRPGTVVHEKYTHINLLKTVEAEFKLGDLGKEDHLARPMVPIWRSAEIEPSQSP